MQTRYTPTAPVEVATPAPVALPVPVPWTPAPMEPTRYSLELPPDLLTRPAAISQQLALLMATHQYTLPAPRRRPRRSTPGSRDAPKAPLSSRSPAGPTSAAPRPASATAPA